MKKTYDYKILVTELKRDPIRTLNFAFAVMSIIPILIMTYLMIGKFKLYKMFFGVNGFLWCIAVVLSATGFYVAYKMLRDVLDKMLEYVAERRKRFLGI